MKFEFVSGRDFNFIESLAATLGIEANNNCIRLPENMGDGFIKLIQLGPSFLLTIHRCRLKEELIIKRHSSAHAPGIVTIAFYLFDKPVAFLKNTEENEGINLSSIHITSTNMEIETCFQAGKNIHSTVLVISSELLLEFLKTKKESLLLKSITSGNMSLWFDAGMTLEIKNVLQQIDSAGEEEFLNQFFYKIKAQELIYLLFTELLKRENGLYLAINESDIQKMYLIKETILNNLGVPPTLSNLAKTICVSESKMKQLFRQIFGKSIYNYYQTARMNEAANLLKHLSVSETGYKLGFVSMSHFSKVFEKYLGACPKKFKNSHGIRIHIDTE